MKIRKNIFYNIILYSSSRLQICQGINFNSKIQICTRFNAIQNDLRKLLIFIIIFNYNFVLSQSSVNENEIESNSQNITSQDSPFFNSYGVYAGVNLNFHLVDLMKIPGYPLCCPHFENGYGIAFNSGALLQFGLFDNIDMQLRLGYNSLNGILTKTENETFGFDGFPMKGKFNYTIDSKLGLLEFNPLISATISEYLNILAGIKIGYFIQNSFEQKEEIVNGVFENGKKVRNDTSGEIPGLNKILYQISAGARYKLPMNSAKTLFLYPELFFDYSLNSIHKDSSWNALTLRIGFSLTYNPAPPEPPAPIKDNIKNFEKIDTLIIHDPSAKSQFIVEGFSTILIDSVFDSTERINFITRSLSRTDTLFLPKSFKLESSIRAVGVDQGIEKPEAIMQIREYSYFIMRPLLNYIFFDKNSAKIPERYSKIDKIQSAFFNPGLLYDFETLPTYHEILNIIGYRMSQFPKAKLTLVGCNSGFEEEKDNKQLSEARAKTIAKYFNDIWSIDSTRIIIKSRNLPENPSDIDDVDGIAENNRVEIYSNTNEVTAPIFINDTLRETTPSIIRFYTDIFTEAGLKEWKITAYQNGMILKTLSGSEALEKVIDWKIDLEKKSIPKFSEPLKFYIEVTDINGQTFKSLPDSLNLEQIKIEKSKNRVGNKKVEHFSLILFDYDDILMNVENLKIKNNIKSRLSENSVVKIAGYTDRMGDSLYNQTLSQARADGLAKALNISAESAVGLGESVLLFNNDTPEGRFYCRTVEVIVETPIEE